MDKHLEEFNDQKLLDIKFDTTLHEESIVFSNALTIQTYHNQPDDEWHIITPEIELVVFKDTVKIEPAEQ